MTYNTLKSLKCKFSKKIWQQKETEHLFHGLPNEFSKHLSFSSYESKYFYILDICRISGASFEPIYIVMTKKYFTNIFIIKHHYKWETCEIYTTRSNSSTMPTLAGSNNSSEHTLLSPYTLIIIEVVRFQRIFDSRLEM